MYLVASPACLVAFNFATIVSGAMTCLHFNSSVFMMSSTDAGLSPTANLAFPSKRDKISWIAIALLVSVMIVLAALSAATVRLSFVLFPSYSGINAGRVLSSSSGVAIFTRFVTRHVINQATVLNDSLCLVSSL
uniref:Uncharacterized protein n=1 Tax=Anopheles darlingi TaxID=43151 RepID=A0A2M4D4W6_ANODA